MRFLWRVLKKRLSERSTWIGIVGMATAAGWALEPDQIEAIAAAGLALWGAVEAMLPEPAGRIVASDPEDEDELLVIRSAELRASRRSDLDHEDYPGGFG